jgi:putative sterol carrier protein
MSLGGCDVCIEMTLKYMNEREAFGKKINKFQVLRHDIVNLCLEVEALRQMVYYTAWLYHNKEVPVKHASMVKLMGSELSNKVVDTCLQCFGGYGYMEEYPIARAYRDSRVGTIVGGTSQIMREILAKIIIDDVKYKKVYDESLLTNEKPWGSPQSAADIIASIPLRIKAEKAANYSTIFHFDISGDGGGRFTVMVQEGKAIVSEGLSGNPDCIITSDNDTYAAIELGHMAPEMAFMSGKIQVSNIAAMMQFSKYFNRVI